MALQKFREARVKIAVRMDVFQDFKEYLRFDKARLIADPLTIRRQKPIVGDWPDVILGGRLALLLDIDFDGNKIGVKVTDDRRIFKGFLLHFFTVTAPFGPKVDEQLFVFYFPEHLALGMGIPFDGVFGRSFGGIKD
jgi:hypothetical protein